MKKLENYKFPDSVLNCGGLIGRIADYTMEQSHRPNRELAIAGAIAWLAHCMGRRYHTESGDYPNLYVLGVGWSGIGKSAPRKTNMELARRCGLIDTVCEDFRSGEALQDAVLEKGKILSQFDEIDTLFESMSASRDNLSINLLGEMLKIWEKSSSFMKRRMLAKSVKRENQPSNIAFHPHFTLFGTGVTSTVYKSITSKMATNGFFARLLIIDGGKRGNRHQPKYREIPADIITDCKMLAGFRDKKDDWEELKPESECKGQSVFVAEAAKNARRSVCAEADAMYDEIEDGADNAIWNRSDEKVGKLALAFAASDCPSNPVIMEKHILMARDLVWYSNNRQLSTLDGYSYESDFEDLQKKIMRIIKRGATNRRELLARLHIKKADLIDVIESMHIAGMIVFKSKDGEELQEDGSNVFYDLP